MIFPATITLLHALAIAQARLQSSKGFETAGAACPKGYHIVTVRANIEDRGHGAMQALVDGLKDMYPDSDDYAIDYPASGVTLPKKPGGQVSIDPAQYQASEKKGYEALKSHLEGYSADCGATRIILLGYSQGAHVVGDVLCGNSNFRAGSDKDAIDFANMLNIRGVITLGDPANNGGVGWHYGNATTAGMFARTDHKNCEWLLQVYGQSWCDEKDYFCDFFEKPFQGSVDVHLGYVSRHKDEILAQAKKLIEGGVRGGSTTEPKLLSQSLDL